DSHRQLVRDWQARAEKAVHAHDDSLIRMALGCKQRCVAFVAVLEEHAAEATETSRLLRNQLETMQAKLGEARGRLGTLSARLSAAELRSAIHAAGSELRFDQPAFHG